jgi:hypothetical protein
VAADRHIDDEHTLLVALGQPLIVLPFEIDGREIGCYFADEDLADAAVSVIDLQLTLNAVEGWSDLDWDELEGALEHNRRESTPSPPIAP